MLMYANSSSAVHRFILRRSGESARARRLSSGGGADRPLAVGAGAGLRLDLTILLLRIDVAVPVRKPWLPSGQRSKFDFSNPVFNLAIGYPF